MGARLAWHCLRGDQFQGSGAIIDWADEQTQDQARRLTLADAREIERRADSIIGVQVRRLVYAELLPRYPDLVKPALFGKASNRHRLIGNAMWPLARRMIIRMHDITADAAAESRSILEADLTGSTKCSLTSAVISRETVSAVPTSPWPVCWLFLRHPVRCRPIGKCLFPRLSLPTANAGATGR